MKWVLIVGVLGLIAALAVLSCEPRVIVVKSVGTIAVDAEVRVLVTDRGSGAGVADARVMVMDPALFEMDPDWVESQIDATLETPDPGVGSTDSNGRVTLRHRLLRCTSADCPAHEALGKDCKLGVVIAAEGYGRFGPAVVIAEVVSSGPVVLDLGTIPVAAAAPTER